MSPLALAIKPSRLVAMYTEAFIVSSPYSLTHKRWRLAVAKHGSNAGVDAVGSRLQCDVTPLLMQARTRCTRARSCRSRLPPRATRAHAGPRPEASAVR